MVTGPSNLIGATLGNYEIQALLGMGGMASVYRAFDRNLQRPVAIKVLSDAAAAQPGFAERFREEARLIANLRHPNIVPVYDFGEQDGLTYMVQELLPGPTLDQRLRGLVARKETLARDEVLAIVRQLAAALDAAHAAGIIHRDVKPANALWNTRGELVLTDFGIAKNTLAPSNHTQVGTVIGTPVYISPEQAQAQPLTPASDIYALGVVLFELLSGKVPFDAPTPLALLMCHVKVSPPPLRPLRPDLPAEVDLVVQQALAKDPDARFRSAGVLAQALERVWPASADANIHNQATDVWVSAVPRASAPLRNTPVVPEPVLPPAGVLAASASAAAPPPRALGRLRWLGMVLALLLIGGVALAARGAHPIEAQTAPTDGATTVVPLPTATPTVSVPAPTAALEPTVPVQPTAVPPTSPPNQVQAPQPAPKDKPGKGKGRGKKH